jgi:predicted Zn-dependent protease
METNMKQLKTFFGVVIATLTLCGTAQAQRNLDLGKLFDAGKSVAAATTGISEKEEIDIGRGLAGRMLGQVELVDDANVQAYVNRVGRWIASQSERPDLPWRFGVANAPNINAMAMPGGTILITRGLYDILDNEAQLAGVLGHEIAHVVKKHHIGVMQKQNLVSAGASLVASRTGNNQLGQVALNFFKNLFISGLDKESEYEADAVGVILAARAGYNAFGLAEVLHKLNSRGASDPSVVDLFGSHPGPTDRLGRLGDLLTPRLSKLPAGLEPELTTVSAGGASRAAKPAARAATPPARAATPPVGARALASESPAAEETPTEAATPAQKPAAGGDLIKGLKGLFGR